MVNLIDRWRQHRPTITLRPAMTLSWPKSRTTESASPVQEFSTHKMALAQIGELFPGISQSFVLNLLNNTPDTGGFASTAPIEHILELETYPKEAHTDNESKREKIGWETSERAPATKKETRVAEQLLRKEFPFMTALSVVSTLRREKFLYPAYLALADTTDPSRASSAPSLLKKPFVYFWNNGPSPDKHKLAFKELDHARSVADQRALARQEAKRDEDAIDAGEFTECACCFDDVPNYKTVHCGGTNPHVFCFKCVKMNTETELGKGRCRPKCMDICNCQADFLDHQLRQCLPVKVMERLIRMRLREELIAAGIDQISECPFCDSMAVLPPPEVNREYTCLALDCQKISCRLCQLESHLPLSCAEADIVRKEKHLDSRHIVEEAMSKALMRVCTKCHLKFVKIDGCNSVLCSGCGNRQCYVCGETIGASYEHFRKRRGVCILHDVEPTDIMHDNEVKRAQQAALAMLQLEEPEIDKEDLAITMSEAVQNEDMERIEAAALVDDMPLPMHIQEMQQNLNNVPRRVRFADRLGPLLWRLRPAFQRWLPVNPVNVRAFYRVAADQALPEQLLPQHNPRQVLLNGAGQVERRRRDTRDNNVLHPAADARAEDDQLFDNEVLNEGFDIADANDLTRPDQQPDVLGFEERDLNHRGVNRQNLLDSEAAYDPSGADNNSAGFSSPGPRYLRRVTVRLPERNNPPVTANAHPLAVPEYFVPVYGESWYEAVATTYRARSAPELYQRPESSSDGYDVID